MIDFATQVPKKRVLDPLRSDQYKQIDTVFSSNNGNPKSDFPDLARRIISSSPGASVGMAFVFGGILGWLTLKR